MKIQISLILVTVMLFLSMIRTNGAESDWGRQALEDAKQDELTLVFNGIKPDKWLVCDTVVRRIPDGRLAYFFLAGGVTEPSPDNYVALSFSSDEGKTWTTDEVVDIGLPRVGKTIGQGPTEFLLVNGGKRILLFFATHSKTWAHDWQSWSIYSDDHCKTWSKPQPLPGRLARNTFIRPSIRTKNGWILVPFQHYVSDGKISDSRNGVLISRDDGATWQEYGDIRCPIPASTHLWAEPAIIELPNNHIVMFIRPEWGGDAVLYRVDSFDGGLTWPKVAKKTDIPNPSSKVALFSLGENTVALVHNPNKKHRSPLSLWISFDGMKTWPYQRIVVKESCDGPKGNLNYPEGFVTPDKKYLYIAFDNNRHQAMFVKIKLPPLP